MSHHVPVREHMSPASLLTCSHICSNAASCHLPAHISPALPSNCLHVPHIAHLLTHLTHTTYLLACFTYDIYSRMCHVSHQITCSPHTSSHVSRPHICSHLPARSSHITYHVSHVSPLHPPLLLFIPGVLGQFVRQRIFCYVEFLSSSSAQFSKSPLFYARILLYY